MYNPIHFSSPKSINNRVSVREIKIIFLNFTFDPALVVQLLKRQIQYLQILQCFNSNYYYRTTVETSEKFKKSKNSNNKELRNDEEKAPFLANL
ncbi:hypothetical protein BpHYR1_020219 [Brachionus plicatilis]|uniref:Uncharacterized protein n=1 Tax=Brachionus plicatilis TaxID=10195 RepID=A0A3M7RHV1_BRAPC|nr:hypothetical protein BpHYR1_020219 [Brachionus plicatilis]